MKRWTGRSSFFYARLLLVAKLPSNSKGIPCTGGLVNYEGQREETQAARAAPGNERAAPEQGAGTAPGDRKPVPGQVAQTTSGDAGAASENVAGTAAGNAPEAARPAPRKAEKAAVSEREHPLYGSFGMWRRPGLIISAILGLLLVGSVMLVFWTSVRHPLVFLPSPEHGLNAERTSLAGQNNRHFEHIKLHGNTLGDIGSAHVEDSADWSSYSLESDGCGWAASPGPSRAKLSQNA